MQIDIKIKHDVALVLFIIQVLEFQTTFSLVSKQKTRVSKRHMVDQELESFLRKCQSHWNCQALNKAGVFAAIKFVKIPPCYGALCCRAQCSQAHDLGMRSCYSALSVDHILSSMGLCPRLLCSQQASYD